MSREQTKQEREVEDLFEEAVEELGGIPYKFKSPGRRFVTDRVCPMPNGEVVWVELKRANEDPTPGQEREHDRLRDRRQWVEVIRTPTDIYKFKLFWGERIRRWREKSSSLPTNISVETLIAGGR